MHYCAENLFTLFNAFLHIGKRLSNCHAYGVCLLLDKYAGLGHSTSTAVLQQLLAEPFAAEHVSRSRPDVTRKHGAH